MSANVSKADADENIITNAPCVLKFGYNASRTVKHVGY